MDWREAAFVTTFTVIVLGLLKLILTAAVAGYGLWTIPPIVLAVVSACLFVQRWANRGFETTQHPSPPVSRLDDAQERLGSSPSVLALPPPDPKRQTSPDQTGQADSQE